MESHTALFMALIGVGKTYLALDSLEREHLYRFALFLIDDNTPDETLHKQKQPLPYWGDTKVIRYGC